MPRYVTYVGLIIALILALLVLSGVVISILGIPVYENDAPEITVLSDSSAIVEGARMAHLLCAQCHGSNDGRLGGGLMPDAAEFGDIYAPNITQHPRLGIKGYTPGQLAYLLRTGIKKDGQYAPPYMVKLPLLSDRDLNNLLAFLKSDHPLVSPSENAPPDSRPNLLTKVLCRLAFKPLPYPQEPIPEPPVDDAVQWGKYLATAKFDCFSCHSQSFKTLNPLEPEKTPGFMGGGNPIPDREGQIVLSANLTMDKESGLGDWTREEFIKTVKLGIRPDGTMVRYPMLPYTLLTEDEIEAIWAYLQTIPPIANGD